MWQEFGGMNIQVFDVHDVNEPELCTLLSAWRVAALRLDNPTQAHTLSPTGSVATRPWSCGDTMQPRSCLLSWNN